MGSAGPVRAQAADSPGYGILVRRWTSHSMGRSVASFGETVREVSPFPWEIPRNNSGQSPEKGTWEVGSRDTRMERWRHREIDAGMER